MEKKQIITIDSKEYVLESLSELARKQITSLQVVDQEIARLQTQLSIAQTARSVFANGLKGNLPADE